MKTRSQRLAVVLMLMVWLWLAAGIPGQLADIQALKIVSAACFIALWPMAALIAFLPDR